MMKPHEVAFKYIGQTEKPGNAGFNDDEFEAKMKAVGFNPTNAWCALFSELVFKEAYPERVKELDKLFSASAVQTYKNFKDAGFLMNELPYPGNLAIWQTQKDGKPHWTGHAGIVYSVIDQNTFECIEGNSNDQGGREGYIVAKRVRKVLRNVKDGLEILGFIQI
ncbi:MAG TPA: CHAP domain-containing protein [Chryseolinea sp.]|nr:CHAP domain-containing protein [Chryseolinea sp.]